MSIGNKKKVEEILFGKGLSKIGLDESLLFWRVHYWLQTGKMKKNQKEYHDGKYWFYNSYSQWIQQFPFWCEDIIKRIFQNLEDQELLIGRNFHKDLEKTSKWYTINYDAWKALEDKQVEE